MFGVMATRIKLWVIFFWAVLAALWIDYIVLSQIDFTKVLSDKRGNTKCVRANTFISASGRNVLGESTIFIERQWKQWHLLWAIILCTCASMVLSFFWFRARASGHNQRPGFRTVTRSQAAAARPQWLLWRPGQGRQVANARCRRRGRRSYPA